MTQEFCTKPEADWLYLSDLLSQLRRYQELLTMAQEEFNTHDLPPQLLRTAMLIEAYEDMVTPRLEAMNDYINSQRRCKLQRQPASVGVALAPDRGSHADQSGGDESWL